MGNPRISETGEKRKKGRKKQISKSNTKTMYICFPATKEVIHDEFVAGTRSQPSILS
jgi:hypothetical protein